MTSLKKKRTLAIAICIRLALLRKSLENGNYTCKNHESISKTKQKPHTQCYQQGKGPPRLTV